MFPFGMPNASRAYQRQVETVFQNHHPRGQLAEFHLDGTARHVIHYVRSGEATASSRTSGEEEGGSSSVSGLDGATVTAGSTSTSSTRTADDDEFPQRVAELFDTTDFPQIPPGFGGAVFNISMDEREPVLETSEERRQRIARNEDRARRRLAQPQVQVPPQPAGAEVDADAVMADADVERNPPPAPQANR